VAEISGVKLQIAGSRGDTKRVPLAVVFLILLQPGMAMVNTQQGAVPGRIVSIVPSVTEMLFAIGAGSQVVGVSSFVRFPDEVSMLPRVGALLDPDMEQIFSLRPDLVILYRSQSDTREQIERAGISVFTYAHGGLLDVSETMRELGRLTGYRSQADRVARGIDTDLAVIRHRVAGRERPRVLLVLGRDPDMVRNVYASGGIGFLHDMLDAAGGANVFAGVSREAVQPTTEGILGAAPDVIIEVRTDGLLTPIDAQNSLVVWDRWSMIPAVRSGRVHFLMANELVVPGPRVATATERLAQILHPEAF